ncbi:MAG: DUF2800 domain-containing protein, partial [Syntrophaceticus sp.]|nr:DUF2800 domain-containing protein [Syntrophaceticus sp.]
MVEFGFWAPVRTGTVRLAAYHKGSDYAAEGTDAHALCEYKLRRALGMEA